MDSMPSERTPPVPFAAETRARKRRELANAMIKAGALIVAGVTFILVIAGAATMITWVFPVSFGDAAAMASILATFAIATYGFYDS